MTYTFTAPATSNSGVTYLTEWPGSPPFRTTDQIKAEGIRELMRKLFGLNPEDMTSKSRERRLVRPRQYAMALCRELTTLSLCEIGALFGGRDHATVLHAKKQFAKLNSADRVALTEVAERAVNAKDLTP
jgi:chromosomal replication initiator protein